MVRSSWPAAVALLASVVIPNVLAISDFTNLPPVPPGLFSASARIEIRSTTAVAWHVLTDFRNYADWNPFTRAAVVVSLQNETLVEQRPVEGARLYLRTQMPPLSLPVDRNTPDKPANTNFAYENITHVQPQLGRVAWDYNVLDELLDAERWQAISDMGNGILLYESREVFAGALAPTLKELYGDALQQAFEAQAAGLKLFLESSAMHSDADF